MLYFVFECRWSVSQLSCRTTPKSALQRLCTSMDALWTRSAPLPRTIDLCLIQLIIELADRGQLSISLYSKLDMSVSDTTPSSSNPPESQQRNAENSSPSGAPNQPTSTPPGSSTADAPGGVHVSSQAPDPNGPPGTTTPNGTPPRPPRQPEATGAEGSSRTTTPNGTPSRPPQQLEATGAEDSSLATNTREGGSPANGEPNTTSNESARVTGEPNPTTSNETPSPSERAAAKKRRKKKEEALENEKSCRTDLRVSESAFRTAAY